MSQRIICDTNQVDYISIRKAMIAGARTRSEVQAQTNVCLDCKGCNEQLDAVLASVCGCQQVPLQDVVDALKNGATTIEAIGEATGAGVTCGRCQALIANVIATGR